MTITFALLVCIVGALVYLLCQPPPTAAKAAELGRIAYFVGLFWFVYLIGPKVARLLD